jgi:hypothetical protein
LPKPPKIPDARAKSIAENADANLGSLKSESWGFSNYSSTPLKTFPMVVRSLRNQKIKRLISRSDWLSGELIS